jgi:hypothetical protein
VAAAARVRATDAVVGDAAQLQRERLQQQLDGGLPIDVGPFVARLAAGAGKGLEHPGMSDQPDLVGQSMRSIQFRIKRAGVFPEVVGRVVQVPAEQVGRETGVQLRIVVSIAAGKRRVGRTGIDAEPIAQASRIAGEADDLGFTPGIVIELHVGPEQAPIPSEVMVVGHFDLRGRPITAERYAAKPIIRHQRSAARNLGE